MKRALFVDGPAAGRVLEVSSSRYGIPIRVATEASTLVDGIREFDAPPLSTQIETAEYYEARTFDLPFGFTLYSLYRMNQEVWAYGIKLLEIVVNKDREDFERGILTRVALAEKRVAEMDEQVTRYRYMIDRLGNGIALALLPMGGEEGD